MGIYVEQLEAASTFAEQLLEFKMGVMDLVNGKLSPLLVPTSIMSSTLADIQNIMLTKYNGFQLSVSSINDGSSLFVTIKLPVSYMRVPLILYSVLSVPVPINSTSTHGTQILDLPKLFLMSDDHQYYSYFNEIDLSMCDGNYVMSCSLGIALVLVTSSSCVLSIFANEKDQVKSLCDFRFVQNVIKPSVVEVSYNQVLLYKTNYISMECTHQHKVIAGCDFLIADFFLTLRHLSH
ncbi:hypothetical protein ACF0H5_009479 [Mactra antiquata]